MRKAEISIPDLLDKLEKFYGKQEPSWPVDPYEFIVWWHCGYPASDSACTKGWERLKSDVGIELHNLLAATPRKIASALKAGGMVPELRALRLKEIAMRVKDEFGGDLRAALVGPLPKARKTLKKFPCIADPGADRILVFAGITSKTGKGAKELKGCHLKIDTVEVAGSSPVVPTIYLIESARSGPEFSRNNTNF